MSRRNRDRRIANRLARPATGMRPTFLDESPLPLAEHPPPSTTEARLLNATNSYLRCYSLGECSVIVTREYGRHHLSIAHPRRDPTWREIAEARYRILPGDVVMAMLLPPLASYINLHAHCFQMIEIDDPAAAAAPCRETAG